MLILTIVGCVAVVLCAGFMWTLLAASSSRDRRRVQVRQPRRGA